MPIEKVSPKQCGDQNVRKHKQYSLSTGGKKAIKKFLSAWFDCVELNRDIFRTTQRYQLFFITLTLSHKQIHCDNLINNQCLQEFLKEITRIYGGRYFWVGERQKNGNIHYHILYDRKADPMIIRRIWNSKQNRLGYVDRYAEKMKQRFSNGYFYDSTIEASNEKQYERYMYGEKTKWKSPNSTDCKPINSYKKMVNYINKYVTKNDNIMCGRCWGRSQGLQEVKPYSGYADDTIMAIARAQYREFKRLENCVLVMTESLSDIVRNSTEVYNHYSTIAKLFYNHQQADN